MKKVLLFFAAMLSLSVATAASGVDWSQYEYLGDGAGGGEYANQFKVQKVDGVMDIVNIQLPGWGTEAGIYMALRMPFDTCNFSNDLQGAGMLLHLSGLTAKENLVKITDGQGEYEFWVLNEKGAEGALEPEDPADVVPVVKFTVTTTTTTATIAYEFTNEGAFMFVGLLDLDDDLEMVEDNPIEMTGLEPDTEYTRTFVAFGVPASDPDDLDNMGIAENKFSEPIVVTFKTEREIVMGEDTHEVEFAEANVAKGCPVYVTTINGANQADKITDGDNGSGACQLLVNNAFPVEWMVVDLGFNYDVTKIQIVTDGDRKDKTFAIYTAPSQDVEPAFANGTMAIADDAWTLAFYGEDTMENGLKYHTFNVDIKDVRYIKYVGVERYYTDQWGVAFAEVRVAGTTNDDSATKAAQISVANKAIYFANSTVRFGFAVENAVGAAVEFDAAQLAVATSDATVATAAIDGNEVVLTCKAEGEVTVTLTYGEIVKAVEISIKPEFSAAPAPTANDVLALYSDAYECTRGYNWFDWGGCRMESVQLDGDNIWHAMDFKYLGSQFMDDTDASGFQYFHVDIYPTAETTVGIVPITQVINEAGQRANAPERGVTVSLNAFEWNSIDISIAEFTEAGVINFDHLYQIKYNKQIQGADQWNADGTFDLYLDNVYFYNPNDPSAIESVNADAEGAAVYYNLQGVRVQNPANGLYIKVVGNKTSKVLVR